MSTNSIVIKLNNLLRLCFVRERYECIGIYWFIILPVFWDTHLECIIDNLWCQEKACPQLMLLITCWPSFFMHYFSKFLFDFYNCKETAMIYGKKSSFIILGENWIVFYICFIHFYLLKWLSLFTKNMYSMTV